MRGWGLERSCEDWEDYKILRVKSRDIKSIRRKI